MPRKTDDRATPFESKDFEKDKKTFIGITSEDILKLVFAKVGLPKLFDYIRETDLLLYP